MNVIYVHLCPILLFAQVFDFGNDFFLNEFRASSVISSEALGLEASRKVLGDQLTKT